MNTIFESNLDTAALIEAKKRLNEEASQKWGDPTWRAEKAQEMSETIYRGFQHENILGLMANVENLSYTGRSTVREVRGLKAFWIALGGYIEASTIHSEVMEIPRDIIGFHVQEFEDKLETNFAETASTLIDLGSQRLDAQINQRALALFQAAVPNTSPYYSAASGVSLNVINTALREVRDAAFGLGNDNITIIGRASMTEQIMDELLGSSSNGAGFLPATNEQLVSRGVIGTYRGANIVTLRNYLDDDDASFFPANELFVIGQDASKFAFYGGLKTKEYVESDNWYWHYLVRRDFGGVVHRPNRVRRIIDTSITA
jgi:hypothetical protein